MIRRVEGDDFLLICQTDHAAVAAELVGLWGNTRFAPPSPRAERVAAVAHHDDGWPVHDDAPTLNARGLPRDVDETDRTAAMPLWQASADRATEAAGPFAGLLVSLHSLHLSINASTKAADENPTDPAVLARTFAVNKFQHRELERQEQLRKTLNLRTDIPLQHGLADPHTTVADDELRFAFRLLQAVDLLSLCLCHTPNAIEKIVPVIPRAGEAGVKLRLHSDEHRVLRVAPWPFDKKRIELVVPAKRISNRPWSERTAFAAAYASAPVESLTVILSA